MMMPLELVDSSENHDSNVDQTAECNFEEIKRVANLRTEIKLLKNENEYLLREKEQVES